MPQLGSSTKVYRAYGKKSTHTVNRAVPSKLWDSPVSSASSNSSYKSALDRPRASLTDYEQEKENERTSKSRNGKVADKVKPALTQPVKKRAVKTIVISSDEEDDSEVEVVEATDSSVEIEQPSRSWSDSTSNDDDDSDDDDDVEIVTTSAFVEISPCAEPEPEWLAGLLKVCSSSRVSSIDSFIAKPPRAVTRSAQSWVKVGEASFSEVYRVHDTVVKIMALHDPSMPTPTSSKWPMLSSADSVQREVQISESLSKVDGFVDFKGAYIVKGCFPQALLDEWDAFKEERVRHKHPEANLQARPGVLPENQYYALICLEDGGLDLEAFRVRSWREARSVFEQTARALLRAEERFDFEHRDLHWGNILIKEQEKSLDDLVHNMTLSSKPQSGASKGDRRLAVSVIDFTLSRMRCGDGTILFDDLVDEALYEGEGDIQFDVYRQMRLVAKDDWQGFYPATNVMWLRYLAHKLLHDKGLSIPARPSAQATPRKRRARAARESSADTIAARAEDRAAYDDIRSWASSLDTVVDGLINSRPKTSRRRPQATHATLRTVLDDLALSR